MSFAHNFEPQQARIPAQNMLLVGNIGLGTHSVSKLRQLLLPRTAATMHPVRRGLGTSTGPIGVADPITKNLLHLGWRFEDDGLPISKTTPTNSSMDLPPVLNSDHRKSLTYGLMGFLFIFASGNATRSACLPCRTKSPNGGSTTSVSVDLQPEP